MTKFIGYSVIIGLSSLVLSACQSTQTVDLMRIKNAEIKQYSQNTVRVHCSGAERCEFARLNDLVIVDEKTRRINRKAIQQGYLKLKVGEALDPNGVYLTIPPQQHEIVIRFYPITREHAEVFHVIHSFKANQKYTFRMFRQRSQGSGSLLNVSAPTPLCVDMIVEKRTIRRFCRPHDAMTGVSEFKEQKI